MKQEQKLLIPLSSGSGRLPALTSRSLFLSILAGFSITFVLTLIIFLAIFLPFHLISLLTILLIIAFIAFIVLSIVTFFLFKPAAIFLYLRSVNRAQKAYNDLYTPLTALTNIRKTVDVDQDLTGEQHQVVTHDEHISILHLVEQQDAHQLVLGVPGAGKTMALRVYQYLASQKPLALIFARGKIPVYVPMKNYSLFIKQRQSVTRLDEDDASGQDDVAHATLLSYLNQSCALRKTDDL